MRKPAWFTVKEVRKNIWAIAEFAHFEKVVFYLVTGDTGAILFDTGMGYRNILYPVRKITDLPLTVFLTHTHWDHTGGLRHLSQLPVWVHRSGAEKLNAGFAADKIAELSQQEYFAAPFKPKKFISRFPDPVQTVECGKQLMVGGIAILPLATPGHSPDSVSYILPDMDTVVGGDTLYPGPLYVHLPESDPAVYETSLKALKKFVGKKTLILPGHNVFSCNLDTLDEAIALLGNREKMSAKAANGDYYVAAGQEVSLFWKQ